MLRLPRLSLRAILVATCLVVGGGLTLRLYAQQSYQQQYALATDPTFQQRVEIAAAIMAVTISVENPAVAFHTQRFELAVKVANAPVVWAPQFAVVVAADTTITSGATDQTLLNRVSGVWNAMAGAGL